MCRNLEGTFKTFSKTLSMHFKISSALSNGLLRLCIRDIVGVKKRKREGYIVRKNSTFSTFKSINLQEKTLNLREKNLDVL